MDWEVVSVFQGTAICQIRPNERRRQLTPPNTSGCQSA